MRPPCTPGRVHQKKQTAARHVEDALRPAPSCGIRLRSAQRKAETGASGVGGSELADAVPATNPSTKIRVLIFILTSLTPPGGRGAF